VKTAAVIFDLDGVLLDSESVWDEERHQFVVEHGGHWQPDSQRRMMGMNTAEWTAYLHEELGVPMPPRAIEAAVLQRMQQRYEGELPLIDGALQAVQRLARQWPLGLASSSPRPLIEFVLDRAHLAPSFKATVSSDEVAHGKPAPDVYLEAARRLDCEPARCVAVEDSGNGLRAAAAAGMGVIAIPNRHYPPDAGAVAQAGLVLDGLQELTPASIESARDSRPPGRGTPSTHPRP
jgi:HAD superfamily hydrolase (TIGR01509 family)